MTCLCLAVLGVFAYGGMKVNLLPDTRYPVVTVTTVLSGTDPEEIETVITRKIEDSLADIPWLKKIESTSAEGKSEVTLQFHLGGDVSKAASEVRSRIRRLWPSFPADTRFPVISLYNPSDAPLALLGVAGKSSLVETSHWVRQTLKPRLSRIKGVAAVRVSGDPASEIAVECDASRLKALGMTVHDVTDAIKRGHGSMPGGFLQVGDRCVHVRTTGNLETSAQISRQPLSIAEQGGLVAVGDLAKVWTVSQPPKETTRHDGRPLVSVAVFSTSDSDMRTLWRAIQETLDEIKSPSEPRVKTIYSQAEELEKALIRLKRIMLLSVIAAGAVLFLFLGSLWATLIVVGAIPFSLLVAVLLMYLFKIPLDLLSMSGLILATGILVDNAIVVIESISRRSPEGRWSPDSIVYGTEEVALPVLFSTLTTVMVFLPLVLVSPEIRIFYIGLTWSVSLGLGASLIAALILAPLLLRYSPGRSRRVVPRLTRGADHSSVYGRMLSLIVDRPGPVIVAAFILLALVVTLFPKLSFRTGAAIDERQFRIALVMPPGTIRKVTNQETLKAEEMVMGQAGVQSVHSKVWGNQARIMVTLKESGEFAGSTGDIMERLDKELSQKIRAQVHMLPMRRSTEFVTISLTLAGPSLEKLTSYRKSLPEELLRVPGIRDVIVHQGDYTPTLEFVVRHDRLGFYGVDASNLSQHLRGHLTGPVAARVFKGERAAQVRVRALRSEQDGFEPLYRTFVPVEGGRMIPLLELARPTFKKAPAEIQRMNLRRVIKLTLLFGRADPLKIGRQLQKLLDGLALDPGYTAELGEEIDDILKTRREMLYAAILAVLLTYLVLVAATESFLQPLIVITVVPFAAVGVIAASLLVGFPITRPVYMGIIILCGLVINVNILMIYSANDRRRAGETPEKAITRGAQRRLQPILMTTLTTVCAAFPMLLDRGTGSSMWAPFALTLASGLTAAALVSPVLTPAMYIAALRLENRIRALADKRGF